MLIRAAVPGAVAAAALTVLTACGTSTSGSPGSSTATAPSRAQLSGYVLRKSDLPSGWTGTAHKDDGSDQATQKALVECIGGSGTDPDAGKTADVNSMDFDNGAADIESSASAYSSQDDVDAQVALVTNPKVSDCYEKVLKSEAAKSLPSTATLTSISIKITNGSNGGPSNVVATGTGTIGIKAGSQTGTAYVTVAFITGPLTTAQVTTENIGKPVDASLVSSLVTKVANRVNG